jgi:enoyl-CoA hydratase/carnithine racemase
MSEQPPSVGIEVLYEIVDDHIAVVTLNRPDKRNAVNGAVASALDYLVKRIEADEAIRVAILASSSDGVFSAGADLAEVSAGRGALLGTRDGGFAGFVDQPKVKPWIAAVTGPALAGGCELALACDMIVASEDSRFGLPEVKRGLFAAAGGVHRLPRALPRAIALEIIATGDPLDVQRALAFGLVNYVVPTADVKGRALDLARAISVNAPLSVRESLKLARLANEVSDGAMRQMSNQVARIVMTSDDAREGPLAFLQKRAPVWKGH